MNKTDIENDFKQRYGNGSVHTCFVPIPLTLMGADCFLYGGSTLITAMNAGVWLCARINSSSTVTIGTTADNIKLSVPLYQGLSRSFRPSYELVFKLIQHFSVNCGIDFLFHCDIPECLCIDTELSRCIAAAILMNDMFSKNHTDISSLIGDLTVPQYKLLSDALLSARKNHAVYIDGKENTVQAVPLLSDSQKIISVYPNKKQLQKIPPVLKQAPPLPLNDLKLDSLPDKNSTLYKYTLKSQNTLSAFRILKNSGIHDFLSSFSDKCSFDECIGFFNSTTQIYFVYDNRVDYIINEINNYSKNAVSFIITGCGSGAQIK